MKKFSIMGGIILLLALFVSCNSDELNSLIHNSEESSAKIAEIDQQVVKINESLAQLQKADKDLGELIASLKEEDSSIKKSLESTKKALEDKIAELKAYVDEELKKSKNWVSATFATLEQYQSLCDEVATLKENLSALDSSLTSKIDSSISSLESSMKTWVNSQLANYYTIAEMNAKLEALQKSVTDGDTTNAEEIEKLAQTLKTEVENLTAAYKKAIVEAITENNGIIDGKIQKEIADVNTRIDNEVKTLGDKIAALEKRIKEIEGRIKTIDEQIASINATLKKLQELEDAISALEAEDETIKGLIEEAKKALEDKIAELKTYVDNELNKTKNWASATFATLTQYQSLCDEVAALKQRLDGIEYDLSGPLSALEESMKTWVNGQLANYYTIAEMNAKLEALQDAITNGDSANAEEIATLKQNLETAKSELTTAYQTAIEEAINQNNGVINQKIADDIKAATDALQEKLDGLSARIDAIENRVAALEDKVAKIISGVQSVVVVPDYSDGSVRLSDIADNKIRFEVYPLEAAAAIAETGPSILSLDYVETLTKSSEDFVNLPITDVVFSEKTLILTVDGTDIPETIVSGTTSANARLRISDGTNTRSSEYFPIYRQESDSQIAITGECSDITQTTAKLYGWSYQDSAEGEEVEFGIEFDHRDLSIGRLVAAKEKDAENKYCCQVGGLRPNELYYYRAYTLYKGLKVYGEVKSFRTAELKVTIKTEDASNIGFQEATLNGSLIVDSEDYLNKNVWFLFGESAETLNGNLWASLSDDGSFSVSLPVPNYGKASMGNSLRSNTTYYYQAVAEVEGHYFYGEIKSFTTKGPDDISLTTGDASDILYTKATLGGSFSIDGFDVPTLANYMSVGFEYGTSAELTDEVKREISSSCNSDGSFQRTITSLLPETKYYYRAVFAVYEDGMVKIIKEGEVKSFTTEPYPIPQAVDMGTVVNGKNIKWASFNVGASSPEEYGLYYAWGETEPKDDYTWSSYKWCNGSWDTLTKYNTKSSYGTVDNKTELDSEDDVASVKLGGKWRMPTDAEWTELRTKCTWTRTTQNGVNGYKVAATNGNSIFLPAAGYWDDTDLYDAGSNGYYWSSSLNTDGPRLAWLVFFKSYGVDRGNSYRYSGLSVRPVSE